MQEKVNLKLLVWMTGGCLLLGTGWYFLHRFQVRRHAAVLLEHADLAESQERLDRATRFVRLYVDLVPKDTQARARYGLLLDRLAQSPRARYVAMQVLDDVLLREPDRKDIRRRLIGIAVALGLFDDALQHLNALGQSQPPDSELEHQRGLCLEARGAYAEAKVQYERAIAHQPSRIESYARCARLLRDRLKQDRDADKLLDKMVELNKESFQAYLTRARFRLEAGTSEETLTLAKADVDEAVRLAPDEFETLLMAAELAQKEPNGSDKARTHLQHMLEQHPKNPRTYTALAALEVRRERHDEAINYLRQGLRELPGDGDMLWNLANLLIHKNQLEEVPGIVAQLEKQNLPAAQVDYLNAAVLFKRERWPEASNKLEAVRPLLAYSREMTIQCDLLLGECYQRQGDFDRQLLVYRQILALDGSQPTARYGVASALYNLGKRKEALEECQRIMASPQPPAAGWILWARLLIAQNLRLPAGQQNWEKVDKVLDSAAEVSPDSTEVPILRAEMLVAQQKGGAARALLEEARGKQPQKREFSIALAELATYEGKDENALAIIESAERQAGETVELLLARLKLLLTNKEGPDLVPALAKVEEELAKFTDADRARLLIALGEAYRQMGKLDQAKRVCKEAVRLQPEDLNVRLQRFQVALESNDDASMEETLTAIERIEGAGGPLGHYNKARLLVWRGKRGDKTAFSAARENLAIVSKRRPSWSRVALSLGEIDDLEGNQERAIEHYLRALDQGDRQPELVRRVVQLLYERRRYSDADLVIQRLTEQTPLFGDLQQIATEVSLQARDYQRALELARKAVPEESKNYHDYVWLGQVLWVTAQQAGLEPEQRRKVGAEAESAFRHALKVADNVPDTWVALVHHLARTGQTKEAETVIREAQDKLSKEQAPLALAQCYAAINRLDKAKDYYQSALQAKPDDVIVLRSSADFYFRTGELQEAEACLRKMITSRAIEPAAATWAQRTLAVVLAARGDYRRSREALLIMERMGDPKPGTRPSTDAIDNQRAKAVILALQPSRAEQRKAIDILEKVHTVQALSLEDQFLLVQLYERIGDQQKARERMLLLLGSAQDNPRYVSHYVRGLVTRGRASTGPVPEGRISEAQSWFAIIEKQQPQAFLTRELKARLLQAQDKGTDVVALFKKPDEIKEPEVALRTATLLEELKQDAAAEPWYRRYVAIANQPESILLLARYLGRQKRLAEALELCERAWQNCAAELVGDACLAVLRTAQASEQDYLRAERRLQSAIQQKPQSLELLTTLAILYDNCGRYPEAEALYLQIIERDKNNAVALNNLAWLLALRDGRGEKALGLINRAMDILGPIPELLDTRAVVCLAMGRADLALADLKEAVGPSLASNVLASVNFHLAQAYQLAGNQREATNAWKAARNSGLEPAALHALEITKYRELVGKFDRS